MIRKIKPKRQPRKIVVIGSKVECEQEECNSHIQILTLSDKMKRAIKRIECKYGYSIEALYLQLVAVMTTICGIIFIIIVTYKLLCRL